MGWDETEQRGEEIGAREIAAGEDLAELIIPHPTPSGSSLLAPFSPWTCTSEISGAGLKSIAEQKGDREIRRPLYPKPPNPPLDDYSTFLFKKAVPV